MAISLCAFQNVLEAAAFTTLTFTLLECIAHTFWFITIGMWSAESTSTTTSTFTWGLTFLTTSTAATFTVRSTTGILLGLTTFLASGWFVFESFIVVEFLFTLSKLESCVAFLRQLFKIKLNKSRDHAN